MHTGWTGAVGVTSLTAGAVSGRLIALIAVELAGPAPRRSVAVLAVGRCADVTQLKVARQTAATTCCVVVTRASL